MQNFVFLATKPTDYVLKSQGTHESPKWEENDPLMGMQFFIGSKCEEWNYQKSDTGPVFHGLKWALDLGQNPFDQVIALIDSQDRITYNNQMALMEFCQSVLQGALWVGDIYWQGTKDSFE